ncbi:helix-turn-helix transcriptional regulator [Methyloceanibacter sp.]|uniref:helix-turn-helix transcriptional regulator n=1 Tax=Methyloceanibacter sp. TaxID=1965321 RepID=UPI003D6CABF6
MRYEKSETVLRIALDMQATALGLSLEDIQRGYADRPLSRRTAERLRDAVERLFPEIEQSNPGEVPKRWRLPGGAVGGLAKVTADELADLATAISVLRRENMRGQVRNLERVLSKIQALLKKPAKARIAPDLEALTEAEGLAMRAGPRPAINLDVLSQLREAIITQRKVRLHYTYRGSRKRGYQIVQPYGFLYGTRHYLVAWSEVDRARDFRKFALSNIERVELLAQTFSRKRGFSIQQYAEGSFGVFHEDPVDVVWKFSPRVASDAAEFLFHPNQVMEPQPDGSLIVRFRAGGLLEMSWHLFTWGDEVEIVKPKRLISLLKEQCRGQLRNRGRDGQRAKGNR